MRSASFTLRHNGRRVQIAAADIAAIVSRIMNEIGGVRGTNLIRMRPVTFTTALDKCDEDVRARVRAKVDGHLSKGPMGDIEIASPPLDVAGGHARSLPETDDPVVLALAKARGVRIPSPPQDHEASNGLDEYMGPVLIPLLYAGLPDDMPRFMLRTGPGRERQAAVVWPQATYLCIDGVAVVEFPTPVPETVVRSLPGGPLSAYAALPGLGDRMVDTADTNEDGTRMTVRLHDPGQGRPT